MYSHIEKNQDYFLDKQIPFVDYKDTNTLARFINQHGRIMNRSRTKLTSKHQREIAQAVKRARYMGFLPYIAY